MIEDEWRYFAPEGGIFPKGPSTWHILDWDQRRIIAVTMPDEQESEDIAVGHLKRYIDTLAPDVYGISLTHDGELESTSTDSKDDETFCMYYPPLHATRPPSLSHIKTVLRSDLLELDRFGPNVDLVSYTPCTNAASTKAVFKYYFLIQFIHKLWNELNLWMRLPPHPNLVPFDRLVLDELHGHVVGFTTLYIPGGTLDDNKSRVFKLEWLRQLTRVIDDLNLKYGIAHQDVADRNLLINPETDALMLFDFNFSGRIGDFNYFPERNDVKGVIYTLYEIITRDTHFRDIPHDQQDSADIEGLKEWVQHPDVKLDHPVPDYRSVLNEWVKRRREGKQLANYKEAPEYIDWPYFPEPPPTEMRWGGDNGTVENCVMYALSRRGEREKGKAILNWERPSQKKLGDGDRVLATGQLVQSIECTGSGK